MCVKTQLLIMLWMRKKLKGNWKFWATKNKSRKKEENWQKKPSQFNLCVYVSIFAGRWADDNNTKKSLQKKYNRLTPKKQLVMNSAVHGDYTTMFRLRCAGLEANNKKMSSREDHQQWRRHEMDFFFQALNCVFIAFIHFLTNYLMSVCSLACFVHTMELEI